MSDKNLEDARRLKSLAREIAQRHALVSSVGITKVDDLYAIKISLVNAPADGSLLPTNVEGVQVVYEVVGQVFKLSNLPYIDGRPRIGKI